MSRRHQLLDLLNDPELEFCFLEGPVFDDAIVGFVDSPNFMTVYDATKVLEILRELNGWDEDEAREFAEFNIFGTLPVVFVWPLSTE